MMLRQWTSAVWAAALAGLSALPAFAQTPEDFYRGRTINVIVGNGPGGGYDAYARLLARHMARHVPGAPQIVVQNMPGAGGLKAMLYLADVAPRDGSVFGTMSRGQPLAPLLGSAKFDGTKLTWIGSVTDESSLCLSWAGSKAKGWRDLLDGQTLFAGQGPGADPDMFAQALNRIMGAKIKLILAYHSTHEISLAMQRGEVEGACGISAGTILAQHAEWLAKSQVNLLLQMAPRKDERFANVPLVLDVMSGEREKRVMGLIVASQAIARPFFGPPGVPQARAEALRSAFDKTMADPAFLAEAKRQSMEVRPMTGAQAEMMMRELYATPRDIIEEAARAIAN